MAKSDFLLSMPRIPDEKSSEYEAFWENEKKKCDYGLTVDGVFIHPWLYWHTQLWKIFIDIEDPVSKLPRRSFQNSSIRDNEWLIADALHEAEQKKVGVMFFGSRQIGKSEFASSYVARGATLYEGTQNVVLGGNWGDIDVIMNKISLGLTHLPTYFKWAKLQEDLRKQIELGVKIKNPKGNTWDKVSWSRIICRNHEEGLDTEVGAGLTPSTFVMDEVGKSKFSEVFSAIKPALYSPFGWRCVPILTGTGGALKKGSDAESFFNNPLANHFLMRELLDEGNKKVSVFISGYHRMGGKDNSTMGDYIQNEKGILLPKGSELFNVKMEVTNKEKAEALIEEGRKEAAQDPDPTVALKEIMYFPKNTKEMFLSDDGNRFPVEAINQQIAWLEANPEQQGIPAKLYRDIDGKVKVSFNTVKKPILDYPIKTGDGFDLKLKKDAAIVIHEMPMDNPESYQYIAGCDPYNESSSAWSNSLGAFYIYKRMYDPISGTFQRRIVASLVTRPPKIDEWHEQCEMLAELYNAVIMQEDSGSPFLGWFDKKGKSYMLADGYDFLKEISPNTSIRDRRKGLPPIPKVKAFCKELVYQYCIEELIIGYHPETNEPIKKLGVTRIADIGLLRELAAFNEDGNFDRYTAFGLTLAHENWADQIYPAGYSYLNKKISGENGSVINPKRPDMPKGPFNISAPSNPFGIGSKGTRNPFGL